MLEIFNRMAARLAQFDMAGLLVAYRADFEVSDREMLEDWGAPGCEYLWLVRETGTNLLRLRLHDRPAQWFRDAMDLAGAKAKIFHITDTAFHEVRQETALKLMEPMDYGVQETLDGGLILHRGMPAARLTFRFQERIDQSPLHHLALESLVALSSQQVGALRVVAHGELERRHTFWAALGSLTLDGVDLPTAMAAARKRDADSKRLHAA